MNKVVTVLSVDQWRTFVPCLTGLPVNLTDEKVSPQGRSGRFWPQVYSYLGAMALEGTTEWLGNNLKSERYDVKFSAYEFGRAQSASMGLGHIVTVKCDENMIILAKTPQIISRSTLFTCYATDEAYANVIRLAYKLAL